MMRGLPNRRWAFRPSFSPSASSNGTRATSFDKRSFAPLLLLPVQIERQKVQGKPALLPLRYGREDAEANLSLQKLLEQRFGRQIPDSAGCGVNSRRPTGTSVGSYIDQGWEGH